MNRWTPFEVTAALRFLRDGRMQTLFILTGIGIGVGVIVFMSAMLAGLQSSLIKRVLTSQPHIQLLSPDQVARPLRTAPGDVESPLIQRPTQRTLSIDQWPTFRDQLKAMPEVLAVSPTVAGPAQALRGDTSRVINLTGMDPDIYFKVVNLPDHIVAGEARVTSDDIVVGVELAHDLGAGVGDKVVIQTAAGGNRLLTITGLVDLGNKGVNQRAAFVATRTAQTLLALVGGVTTIDVTVRDVYAAETLAREIAASIPAKVDSWIKTNAQLFTAIQAQKSANTMIRLFVGLSVAFGIAAVLVVSVIQRSQDIGILRAMGTARIRILRIFLIQGGLLGLLGSLLGSALGATALIVYHNYARQFDGTELFPLLLERSLFAVAALLATITGVAAAAAPAVRAANLDPVAAIRG